MLLGQDAFSAQPFASSPFLGNAVISLVGAPLTLSVGPVGISTTMNLGGDDWPIYLSPNENVGAPNGKNITAFSNAKGIKVDLKPGDMLVYSGCELEHWRNKFKGKECIQAFFHYNNRKTLGAKDNIFDKRLHLGLPSWFKR